MRSEIIEAVTIYEINGVKYTGRKTIDIKSHPRLLSFVKLRIDGQEYSLGSDDLMRAVDRAARKLPAADDGIVIQGPAGAINRFAEERASEQQERLELPR